MKDQLISSEAQMLAISKHSPSRRVWPSSFELITQTSLQRWLREEFNLHIMIDHQEDGYAAIVENGWIYESEDKDSDIKQWSTYEEALEAALIETLKLIK